MEHIEDQAMRTDWLPEILPKGVRLIISSNPNSKLNRILSKRKDRIETLRIEELNWTERKLITSHLLKKFGKTLTDSAFDNQLAMIASKREAIIQPFCNCCVQKYPSLVYLKKCTRN